MEVDAYIKAGQALQRFWLTATALDLQVQPEMTPLIFASYTKQGLNFTQDWKQLNRAKNLAIHLEKIFGSDNCQRGVFMGRIGAGPPAQARSERLPLTALIKK